MFVRLILTFFLLSLIIFGLVDYLKNIDENECSMTYMRQAPGLIPINLPKRLRNEFPLYKLYLYCEGNDCQKYESLQFNTPGHIPALFVTGNADSHMQIRSVASVALEKSRQAKYNKIKFHFFTISFNEELSALYGPLLESQTKFVKHCINHILSLFQSIEPVSQRPKSVLVIGNSMGGIVARGIFLESDGVEFENERVHTIITQATPHQRPVINFDVDLYNYYKKVNNLWLNGSNSTLKNVVLASLYGGVRDILVRAGLANLNDWKSKSTAAIVSSYTVTMPFVWRTIDHRCMSWCRELVMNEVRALFKLVDETTGQIYENKETRERILRENFEGKFLFSNSNSRDLIINGNLEEASEAESFTFNDYNNEKKLVSFDLNKFLLTNKADSLFVYTNINSKNSIVLCDHLNKINESSVECLNTVDLLTTYAQLIPPYFEGHQKVATLRTINLLDVKKSLRLTSPNPLILVKIPKRDKNALHQVVLKFDWYLKSERVHRQHLPKIFLNEQINLTLSEKLPVFTRFYLPDFKHIWQTYDLNRISSKNYCENLLIKHKAISASDLLVQFHEPTSESTQTMHQNQQHTYHSQAIQLKNKNLTMRLTVNGKKLHSFIDLIRVDAEHLIEKSKLNWLGNELKNKCSNGNENRQYQLEIRFNYLAMLGQIFRFYAVLSPAFIVFIIQLFDFLIVLTKPEESELFQSFLILNRLHSRFVYHIVLSSFVTLVCFVAIQSSNFDSIFSNDWSELTKEGLFFYALPFIVYWFAYAVLSLACVFLSLIIGFISILLNKILLNLFGFLKHSLMQYALFFFHFVITIGASVLVSTLAHCCIFYAEIIRSALRTSSNAKHLQLSVNYTRTLLVHLLLVLNLPALIVWTKSLQAQQQIQPLFVMKEDNGVYFATLSLTIYLFNYLKDHIQLFRESVFKANNRIVAVLIFSNALLTILFASLSLYRLSYFILFHLTLMLFYSVLDSNREVQGKDTKKND